MKAERAIVAAVCIAVAYATLVGVLVGIRGIETWTQGRVAKSLARQRNRVECETAPAGASTPSGGLTAPSRTTERNG